MKRGVIAGWRFHWQTLWTAIDALRRNRLRSALTVLGIVIGVAAVVVMSAIGNGAQDSITRQVAALGQNLLTVFAGSKKSGGISSAVGSAGTLTVGDAVAIQRETPDIRAVSPEIMTTAQVIANGRNWSTSIVGEGPDYLQIRDWKLTAGTMFTERDVKTSARVAVIGAKTAHELFGPLNPVGQRVRVKDIPFVVVGLLEPKGAGMGGQNQDDRIIVPFTTAMKRITGDRYLRSINVQVSRADRVDVVQQQIVGLLRQRHRLPPGHEDDFNLFNQKEIADTVSSITGVIKVLLGAVASLSLVVGGIGIMNIMLVSVTERTREIGIRIAVGARASAIQLQFLAEAVVLSLFGGLAGIIIGVSMAGLVRFVADFAAVVSTGSIGLAFGVSFAVGVLFGYLPARRAAALDPIEALRYE